jgi:hypothetical protein
VCYSYAGCGRAKKGVAGIGGCSKFVKGATEQGHQIVWGIARKGSKSGFN